MELQELSLADLFALKSELKDYIAFYKREHFAKIAEDVQFKLTAVEKEINNRINSIQY